MIRIILAVSALTVAVAALAPAAPAPSYFPLAQGATWVRKAEDGATITAGVTGAKVVGSVRCTVIETKSVRDNRERITKTCYEATASGVFVIETVAGPRTIVLDPPRPLLLLPPAAGRSWTWSPKDSPIDVAVSDRWIREETVRVPAGTFRAWKLESVTKRADMTVHVFTWFAHGVGIVKIAREATGGTQEREGGSELVSYKIP